MPSMGLESVALGVTAVTGALHAASMVAYAVRVRRRPPLPTPADGPRVTLLRPVCGVENHLEAALRTSFTLSYQRLELIFCVDDESDAVVPVVRRLIAQRK